MNLVMHHGGALEVLRQYPTASCTGLLTDPPYARTGGAQTTRTGTATRAGEVQEADQFWTFWFAGIWAEIARVCQPDACGFIFTDWRTIHALEQAIGHGWTLSQVAVWDREGCGLGTPLRASHELIAFVRGPEFHWHGPKTIRNVFRCPWPYGGGKLHGAEKPVALLRELLPIIQPLGQGRILDPFMGSGSTLAACRMVGHDAVGIEQNAECARGAADRLGLRVDLFADGVIRRDESGNWWLMNKEDRGWNTNAREVLSPEAAVMSYRIALGEAGADEHSAFVRYTRLPIR